jgi:hypothetical protein
MVVFSVAIFHTLNRYYLGIWDFKSFFIFIFFEGALNSLLSRKELFKFHGIMVPKLKGYAVSTKNCYCQVAGLCANAI